MKDLNKVLSDIDIRGFSSIHEVGSEETLSSLEFKERIKNRVIELVKNFPLQTGHCVILQSSNSIKFFIDFLALYFLGITAVPLDPESNQSDLETLINSLRPLLLLNTTDSLLANAIIHNDFNDTALILFTSGSTTKPKGVMISSSALEKKFLILNKYIGKENVENSLCFIPTFFGHGLIGNSLYPIFFGKNFFIAKKLTMEFGTGLSDFLESKHINFFSTVPSHWEIIAGFGKNYKGSSLKRVHCASALLKTTKIEAIKKWLGQKVKFFDVYGATEMLGWFACREITSDSIQGYFSEYWEVEQTTSTEGELILKSDYMYKGYWQEGQLVEQKSFNTGDIFHDGILSGRTKNIVNINGIKIQIEDVVDELNKSGLIDEAAAFSINDNFSGERIGAAVVLKPKVSLDELWSYCRANISPVKIPGEILCIDTIPTNGRGKIATAELVSVYEKSKDDEKQLLEIFNNIFKTKLSDCNVERAQIPDWDSMRHAELLIKIQDRFKIKFSVKEIIQINNFMEVKNIVSKRRL